jgi:hypothetical protein
MDSRIQPGVHPGSLSSSGFRRKGSGAPSLQLTDRGGTQLRHVLSDMKFIEYPVGGYIAPHVDGVRTDEVLT